MKCCANSFFNQQCLAKKVIPNYAKIKIPCTSAGTNITQKKVQTVSLKDEIKFLYVRKEKLNGELYRIHLKAAQEWRNTWHTILDCTHDSINQYLERKYKIIVKKTKYISTRQTRNFHTSVNKADITYSDDELTLLNKGLKYNLNHKR
jgi:hypothetical protein